MGGLTGNPPSDLENTEEPQTEANSAVETPADVAEEIARNNNLDDLKLDPNDQNAQHGDGQNLQGMSKDDVHAALSNTQRVEAIYDAAVEQFGQAETNAAITSLAAIDENTLDEILDEMIEGNMPENLDSAAAQFHWTFC